MQRVAAQAWGRRAHFLIFRALPDHSCRAMRRAAPVRRKEPSNARGGAHSEGLTAPAPGTTMRAPKGALRPQALSSISNDHGRTP